MGQQMRIVFSLNYPSIQVHSIYGFFWSSLLKGVYLQLAALDLIQYDCGYSHAFKEDTS